MAAYRGGGPSDHDLITLVLRPLVAGHQRLDAAGGFIHVTDVYSAPPERLAERYAPSPSSSCWYFLCPARCRNKAVVDAPGDGNWRSAEEEAVGEVVRDASGRRVGYSRALAYGAKTTAPWAAVTRRGWCMVELALDERGDDHADLVLCKMFRSPTREAAAAAFRSKRKVIDQHPEAPPAVRQHC